MKQVALEKIERLQSQLERVEDDMVRTRKEADAKIERVRASGIEDRKQIGKCFKAKKSDASRIWKAL